MRNYLKYTGPYVAHNKQCVECTCVLSLVKNNTESYLHLRKPYVA